MTLCPPPKNVKKYSTHPSEHPKQRKPSVWEFGEGTWVSERTKKFSVTKQRRDYRICEWFWVSGGSMHTHQMRKEFGISWSKFSADDSGFWLISWTKFCLNTCLYKIKAPNFITKNGHFYNNSHVAQLSTVPTLPGQKRSQSSGAMFCFSVALYWLISHHSHSHSFYCQMQDFEIMLRLTELL